jgi:ketosteroid isomerase-like protein
MKNPAKEKKEEDRMKSIPFVLCILIAWSLPLSLDHSISVRSVPKAYSAAKPSPPTLMATEQEVRAFFDRYIDRYNQMDTDGFLGLFSLKATQNQQDGLPEIRKIYSDYFSQMTSLQNSLEDMKIEIYQNAVEVRARYSVNQVLKGGEKKVLKGSARWTLVKEGGSLKILSIQYKHGKTP